jgi:hypothetical protein
MRTSTAGVSTAVFFLTGPPTVVGLIPWLISRWEIIGSGPAWRVAQVCGVLLIIAG